MKTILANLVLTVFGTALLLYSVIFHEPPAFFAYLFGILTGLCWAGLIGLWWLRQDALNEENSTGHDADFEE